MADEGRFAMPIALRADYDAARLRGLARKTKDGPQARRLLALAAIYDGATRTQAAGIGGVTLQIVRDWVMKFNGSGPDGLIDRKAPGQPSKLKEAHRAALATMSRAARSRRSMGWCAGGSSICASGSSTSSGSRCRRRP
jgi:hypothetical protein